jgi:hypothetical protein
VNYSRKLTSGSEADRNQGARRESLNGKTGKMSRQFTRKHCFESDRFIQLATSAHLSFRSRIKVYVVRSGQRFLDSCNDHSCGVSLFLPRSVLRANLCGALHHSTDANRSRDGSRCCGASCYCVEHRRESKETSNKKPTTGRTFSRLSPHSCPI